MSSRFSLLVVGILSLVHSSCGYTFEDCERWAKSGECTNNPRFIWLHCLSSCLAHAKDDNAKCSKWRDEGECSANKKYVPLHCPRSCDLSTAWHPHYRSALNIDEKSFTPLPPPDHTPSVALEYVGHSSDGQPCPSISSNSVYMSAITMQSRITNIMKHNSYIGFGQDAPSEFLQSYGVLEGMLYALRLYDIVLSTSRVASRAEKRVQEIIDDIEDSLNNYDGDKLTRRMRAHLYRLEEAGQLVTDYLEKEVHEQRMRYAMDSNGGERCQDALRLDLNDVHRVYASPPSQLLAPTVVTPSQVKDSPPVFTLSNGVDMPSLGLGTWKLTGEACEQAVYDAIKVGYRAIDTAQAYGNEAEVGKAVHRAIAEGLVTRDDLFIATKLSFPEDAGERVRSLIQRQLELLKTDYVDLYYLHSPLQTDEITRSTWSTLEKLYKEGVLRSLGLSNHNSAQLRHHISLTGTRGVSRGVSPMVLQNKFDVYHPGKQLDNQGDAILQTCAELGVQLVGYSPFSSFPFSLRPLDDPLVGVIASHRRSRSKKADDSSPAAVLTQWSLQQGVALIPRSSSIEHMRATYAAAVAVSSGLAQEGKLRGSERGEVLTLDEMSLLGSLANLVSSPLVKPLYGKRHP